MISPFLKKMSSSGRILATRSMGAASGGIKAVRKAFGLRFSYRIDPCNGNTPSTVDAVFPDDEYAPLETEPTWAGHRFLGWFDASGTPNAAGTTAGSQLADTDVASPEIPTVYAQWQLPSTVTFDATTNGGQMPSGWSAPYYYAGQPYGTLPAPTHATLNFGGWYLNGVKITAASLVPSGGATLVAQYVAASFSVDLNDGAWVEDATINPDASAYDGVYKSTNAGQDDTMAKMYISVVGYTSFRILIASDSEASYDYVVAMQPDIDPDYIPWDDTVWGEGDLDPNIKATTASSAWGGLDPSELANYMPVDYALDGGQHTICVLYRKDSGWAEGSDTGFLLIPKVQGGS